VLPETEPTGELPGLNAAGLPDPPPGAATAPDSSTGVNAIGCDAKAGLARIVPVTVGPVPAPVVPGGARAITVPDRGAAAKRR
jgi:hypothetical protein